MVRSKSMTVAVLVGWLVMTLFMATTTAGASTPGVTGECDHPRSHHGADGTRRGGRDRHGPSSGRAHRSAKR